MYLSLDIRKAAAIATALWNAFYDARKRYSNKTADSYDRVVMVVWGSETHTLWARKNIEGGTRRKGASYHSVRSACWERQLHRLNS
jgi:hypothetical protein